MSKPKPTDRHLYGRWRFVEDPNTGLVHCMVDENAIDAIRLNGWTDRGKAAGEFDKYVPPKKAEKPKPVRADGSDADDDDGEEAPVEKPLVPEKYAADDPKAPLYDLRKQLLDLGMKPGDLKRNWGLARLTSEISKLKSAE